MCALIDTCEIVVDLPCGNLHLCDRFPLHHQYALSFYSTCRACALPLNIYIALKI